MSPAAAADRRPRRPLRPRSTRAARTSGRLCRQRAAPPRAGPGDRGPDSARAWAVVAPPFDLPGRGSEPAVGGRCRGGVGGGTLAGGVPRRAQLSALPPEPRGAPTRCPCDRGDSISSMDRARPRPAWGHESLPHALPRTGGSVSRSPRRGGGSSSTPRRRPSSGASGSPRQEGRGRVVPRGAVGRAVAEAGRTAHCSALACCPTQRPGPYPGGRARLEAGAGPELRWRADCMDVT